MTDRLAAPPRVAISLEDAALCGLDHVFSQRDYRECPSCGSASWVPVSQFLGVIPEPGFILEKIERVVA